jgi:carbon storage regulator
MLVLARRPGEEIVIGGNIRVTILSARGGLVRLGIAAPPAVTVDRKEVRERRAGWGPSGEVRCGEGGR